MITEYFPELTRTRKLPGIPPNITLIGHVPEPDVAIVPETKACGPVKVDTVDSEDVVIKGEEDSEDETVVCCDPDVDEEA